MAKEIHITLPKLGESIVSATVVQWFKREGEEVALDEALLEVSTDKVNSEIPSPVAGRLKKIITNSDTDVDVGEPLAVIAVGETESADSFKASSDVSSFLSPAVLHLAKEEGVDLDELQSIKATGRGGRLSKKDVEKYLSTRQGGGLSQEEDERVPMTKMRKIIAQNMVRSFYQAPHASLVSEVDVTECLGIIAKEKERFLTEYSHKLTITAFIAKAIACAAQKFPFLNASLEDDTIVVKKGVHLGIAVSVKQGIVVPVVKNCHIKSLVEIAQDIGTLAQNARAGQLALDSTQEGTITMTNFGMAGTQIGIPIIRHPEVAIVGVGAIEKKVSVLESDHIAIRSKMHLSLTFDHRVVDGIYGCDFLKSVKTHLEEASGIS